jgi:hypothetical protein
VTDRSVSGADFSYGKQPGPNADKRLLSEKMLFGLCKNTKNFGIYGRYFEEYLKNILNR